MDSELLHLEVGDRRVVDLTSGLARFCRGRGDGLVNVFAPHATAGLALLEIGSGSEATWPTRWSGSSPATTATATGTAPRATAPTTCCRHW